MPSIKAIAHVVPHTHWDREWRYPIWKNRVLLQQFMRELLNTLDTDPQYRNFVMDGQCAVIEDYLEVAPQDTDRIKEHVASGRLSIGPWYTLPDLYPVNGECLLRNLLKGIRVSKSYGKHLKIGYNSFGWGQISQFPQIYDGFDIKFIVAAKKVSAQRAPQCEFLWQSPDGTQVLTTRLGPHARANMFFNAYIPIRFGMQYLSQDYRHNWATSGQVIHNASADQAHQDYFKVQSPPGYFRDLVKPSMLEAWNSMDISAVPHCRLILNGSDFSTCQPELSRILADANADIPDVEFVHSTIEAYARDFAKRVDQTQLQVVKGELRDGAGYDTSGNALAVRMDIKIMNKQAENSIINRAEPAATLMSLMGADYPTAMLALAWKHLLHAHAHDSINGVTQDKTAHDTRHNIRQAIEISEVLHQESMSQLMQQIDTSSYPSDSQLILAYNPLPYPVSCVTKLTVDTPQEDQIWSFDLIAPNGRRRTVQQISRQEQTSPVHDLLARPWPFYHDRHTVYADLGTLPAGGYSVFQVKPSASFVRCGEWWPETQTTTGDAISMSNNQMENQHLHVAIDPSGTITITDKATNQSYSGLHYFEDSGDTGDYWVRYPPYDDQIHNSIACPKRIWRTENGPLAASIAVETTMTLPLSGSRHVSGTKGESARSADTAPLVITSVFTLKKGARQLEVSTTVNNTISDHRLRIMFPTDVESQTAEAASHFCVEQRNAQPAPSPDGTFHAEMQTQPMQQFVDVSDGARGLAIISNCFTEYELQKDRNSTLAITLFRAVKNRICTEFRSTGDFPDQHGGQLLQTIQYDYAIKPHNGNWSYTTLHQHASSFNTPPTLYQFSPSPDSGSLPATTSLFSISSPHLVLSCLKKSEDRNSFIARIYNPTDRAIRSKITLPVQLRRAYQTNLNEKRLRPLKVNDHSITLSVPPCKIQTIELL